LRDPAWPTLFGKVHLPHSSRAGSATR
jgi:hypothetical protein